MAEIEEATGRHSFWAKTLEKPRGQVLFRRLPKRSDPRIDSNPPRGRKNPLRRTLITRGKNLQDPQLPGTVNGMHQLKNMISETAKSFYDD
jgi:hypothetical protein